MDIQLEKKKRTEAKKHNGYMPLGVLLLFMDGKW